MKKLWIAICMITCLFTLTACGAKKTAADIDKDTCQQVSKYLVMQFSQLDDTGLEELTKMEDKQLDAVLSQSGVPVEGAVFKESLEAWKSAVGEAGDFKSVDSFKVEAGEKEAAASSLAKFENRDAEIVFTFDKASKLESTRIDVKYTTGEILKKAGLNTLLGMGTVFFVLIFISLLIYCFKFIPKGQNGKKEMPKEIQAAEESVQETVTNQADDLELAAVIAAAIAASTGQSEDSFVVRSIKRRRTNKW